MRTVGWVKIAVAVAQLRATDRVVDYRVARALATAGQRVEASKA